MRTQKIHFPGHETFCIFPNERSNLAQAIVDLGLKGHYPVIVLIGGEIDTQSAVVTRKAIETISGVAEDLHAVVICGGTDLGIMAAIGQTRARNGYRFPLVGVTPEELVTWPGGPRNTKLLWWGKQRWQLEPHYSHFILVPGSQFGHESPWIVDTATLLSKGYRSVTILINGGEVSRKDIQLSLKNGRHVIALSRTGGLADELARQPERDNLIKILPVGAVQSMAEAIQRALSIQERIEEPITFRSLIQ